MKNPPTKERIKEVIDEVDDLDLSDGAHWQMVHQKLGLKYGDVFPLMERDPEFFGITYPDKKEST